MKRKCFTCFAVILIATGCSSADQAAAQTRPDFNPRVVIEKPFPAITNARIVDSDQANKGINGAELVLGVVVNGKARAYPINMMNGPRREIVNDQLGGQAIAATW